ALVSAVASDPNIEVVEDALVLDLLRDSTGAAQGLTLHVMGQGPVDGVGAALAPAVVLATGGIGQVFASSTNPAVATGDGIGLGLRAGAAIADLEFVQFHPTVLWLGDDQRGQQPLISEALRGEGAVLLDNVGERFLVPVHPMAELAPRDVVAKAMTHRMRETGMPHVWLDATGFGREVWERRFPTILDSCRTHGIDPLTQLIPVAPAQHYSSGGLLTDLHGRTSVEGLFAVGEVACTGVHGANRLASNSLLEGLVFADRIGSALADGLPDRREPVSIDGPALLLRAEDRHLIQDAMTDGVGVLRTADSMAGAVKIIDDAMTVADATPSTHSWETTNVALTARVLAEAAALREETRGSHWRDDFPDQDNERWRVRIVSRRQPDGELVVSYRRVEP
ncbi:MAG: FAD-binding protein, partial [Actinomycetes bacterium]